MKRVQLVVPPPLPDLVANHEAAAGIGSLGPGANGFAYPPHLVASCAASARAAGWQVSVADGTRASMAQFVAETDASACDLLAVQVGAGTWLSDLTYLRMLRHHGRASDRSLPPVLLFGPSAGQAGNRAVEEGVAAAALVGEAELAIVPAMEGALAGRRRVIGARELLPDAHNSSGLICELDSLPIPAWDAAPWQSYGMVTLLSARGCGAGCRYCAYTLSQGTVTRAQSVDRTLAEWKWIAETQRPPRLIVRDTVFAQDRARVVALCEGILSAGLKTPWECESRPEHFDRELIRLMKRAGCTAIKIGMESGDPQVLVALGRVKREGAAEYLAHVRRVAGWCREAGLRCRVFVLAGLPGQSTSSLEMTRAALERLPRPVTINPSVYRAYPGLALQGQAQPVSPAALERLQAPYSPPLYRRALHRVKQHVARGNEERGRERFAECPPAATGQENPRRQLPQQYLLAGSRVFLTGGSGFVGGHVARALASAGAQVVALLRPNSHPGPLADIPAVEIVRGDLSQPGSWSSALRGCGFCFHVAALYAGSDKTEELMAVNAYATGTLLAACAEAGVSRFIHTSTVGTVGRPRAASDRPDETMRFNLWDQCSPYVRSKYLGELLARSWNGAGLEVVIVKPTAPVGAGDARPTATGKRILAALKGELAAYPPGGINHAPVTDVAAGHLLAAERGQAGESYILGHCNGNLDRAVFLRLVADAAASLAIGKTVPNGKGAAPGGLLDSLTADPRRAVEVLGLPQSDLAAAFRESVAWFVEHDLAGETAHAGVA